MYQETLNEIKANQLGYELSISESQNSQSLTFLEKLIESISKSNFYGSETYLCMGTIYHILGYIQNLGAFEMKKEYFEQSAIENYMDMFRYYKKMEKEPEYAIIKMSKYAYRVYHALSILKTFTSNNTFNIKNLNKDTNIYKDKLNIFKKILKELKGYHSFDTRKDLKNELHQLFVKLNVNKLNVNSKNVSSVQTNSNMKLAISEPTNNNQLLTISKNTNDNFEINNNKLLISILNKMFKDIESIFIVNKY